MKSLILPLRILLACLLLLPVGQQAVYAFDTPFSYDDRTPVSWSVSRKNDQITIQWNLHTASQIVSIEIEKTTDQRMHLSVDTLPGQRIRNYTIQYTFTEQPEFLEDVWYRLKMTDTQRKVSYSPYVFLSSERTNARLYIRPSPSNGEEVQLLFEKPLKYDVHVSIQDRTGRVLYESVYRPSSKVTIRFNGIPVLAPGFYQVVVDSYDYSARQTLQVQ